MNRVVMIGAATVVASIALGGCATTEVTDLEKELQAKEQENAELQASLQDQERRLMEMEARSATGGGDLLPPQAKPGECYARVFAPPTYKTVTKTVLKREAAERVETVPAQYQWVEEKVQVREASQRLEVVPAKYDWVEERVLVREASEELKPVPATYRTVEEKILVRKGYQTWKKGRGPIEKIDDATGEIMCLVEVPPEYKIVTKRVVDRPAGVQKIAIPAEYKMVRRKVMVEPPKTRTIEIPAEYQTVRVKKLVTPAKEKRVPIPEEFQTVSDQVLLSEGNLEWRPILCETNTTPDVVRRVQSALKTAGHYPGPVDGRLGSQTMNGVRSYQRANGLATGQLTMETLKHLKVM